EVVRIHVPPAYELRRGVDKNIEPEGGSRPPKGAQARCVQRLSLNLRGDDDPGEAELDGAALELGPCLSRMERRDVRESDEAAGMILFGLVHAVVDQAAGSNVRLIEARAAGEHRNVDARLVHHSHMRRKIGEQRIEAVIWSAVFVEAKSTVAFAAFHQLGRRIMMLEINDHSGSRAKLL